MAGGAADGGLRQGGLLGAGGFNGYFIRYPESYCDKEVLHKSSAKKGNDWRQKVSVGAWEADHGVFFAGTSAHGTMCLNRCPSAIRKRFTSCSISHLTNQQQVARVWGEQSEAAPLGRG